MQEFSQKNELKLVKSRSTLRVTMFLNSLEFFLLIYVVYMYVVDNTTFCGRFWSFRKLLTKTSKNDTQKVSIFKKAEKLFVEK